MLTRARDLEFVELHARSAFSFLTGASGPEAVVRRVAELGGGAVAVVDAGGFYGSARAHQARRRIDNALVRCQFVGMTRTQIQLPDETFARAKKVCEAREISLAELARRGIEYILSVYDPELDANRDWQPPTPRNLGWKGLSHAEIKAEAQKTSSEVRLTRRAK